METLRIKQFQKTLKHPLLVVKKENLFYFTGQHFIDGYLLITPKSSVFLGNGLEQARGIKSGYLYQIDKYLRKGESLAVEDVILVHEWNYLKNKLKGVKLIPASGLIEEMRAVKSRSELSELHRAYEITAQVFATVKSQLKKKQWTEAGLARYIRVWGLELGADEVSFDPIVAAGANAAIPHHRPGEAVLKPNQSIVLDFGFKANGYCSDFTRTVFIGKVPPKLKDIYNHTEAAYNLAFGSATSGQTGEQLDQGARRYLKQHKLDKYFIHSLGHGTGLEVHEQPAVSPRAQNQLQDGMVFSIEPGVYVPKLGGVRIEDLVFLDKGQPQYFVKVPTVLKENII